MARLFPSRLGRHRRLSAPRAGRSTTRGKLPRQVALEPLERRTLLTVAPAPTPAMVQDINPYLLKSFNSDPNLDLLSATGGKFYFTANDHASGFQVYASDGTAAGTTRLTSIPASTTNPVLSAPLAVGSTTFFVANDGTGHHELWSTDGTAAGTSVLHPGGNVSALLDAGAMADLNGTLLFLANDGTDGEQLWTSDGTATGTVMVSRVNPSGGGLTASDLTVVGNTLFFIGNDGSNGTQLWKSDGTAANTVMVTDVNPTSGGLQPIKLFDVNGTLLFSAANASGGFDLWTSDGTAANTTNLATFSSGMAVNPQPVVADGKLFFTLQRDLTLYASDGTAAGTGPVNRQLTQVDDFTNDGGTFYFTTFDNTNGNQLWTSDGTAAGTTLVVPASTSGFGVITDLTAANGRLFYIGGPGLTSAGNQLWTSDGTAAGTRQLSDAIDVSDLTAAGGTLYFDAFDAPHGDEIWKSDGTVAGTGLVSDIFPGAYGSAARSLMAGLGQLFFSAFDPVNGRQVWTAGGSDGGATRLTDLERPPADNLDSDPLYITAVHGRAFLVPDDGTHGVELWQSDGTAAGTAIVKDINPGTDDSNPFNLANINGELYFAAYDPLFDYDSVWKSDGTAAGTVLVATINSDYPSYPASFTGVGGQVFFTADDGTHGNELWKTDGTTAGTTLVDDINPAGDSNAYDLTAVGGALYFAADDGTHGNQLWKTDGTATGTTMLSINPTGDSGLYDLVQLNGTLYFLANDGTHGYQLWKSDAQGATMVSDINPSGSPNANNLTVFGGKLYFTADDGADGTQIWETDGTAAPQMVTDIVNPTGATDLGELMAAGGTLFFVANDGQGDALWRTQGTAASTLRLTSTIPDDFGGTATDGIATVGNVLDYVASVGQLWQSDGTVAGTKQIAQFSTADSRSEPNSFANVGGALFFNADDGVHGNELWSIGQPQLLPANVVGVTLSSQVNSPPSNQIVATFTDPNGPDLVGNYSANIDWGDNTATSPGTISFDPDTNVYTVTGAHTYASTGTFTITVTVHDATMPDASATSTATVSPPDLALASTSFAPTEGVLFSGTVGLLTDADQNLAAGNYTATIDWGDGSSLTAGGVTASAGGGFDVTGSHTYAEEANNLPITVVVTDTDGDSATVSSTASVADAALSATATPIAATEGQAVTLTVASFTDANPATFVGDYTATIDWGDGSSVATGSVTANAGGGFAITGTHTYGEEASNLPVTVVIRDTGGAIVTAVTTANVADAALSATATPIAATEGQAVMLTVASFTDANPATVVGDYTATIDWGDGSSLTTGSVTASAGGGFAVTGTHTYHEAASNLPVTVVIRDTGGATVTATTTVNVADAALSATAAPIAATEGQSVTLAVASFTDANPGAVAGGYTATIDWGDGSSVATGSVTASAGGGFAITGTHTYGEEASNLPVTVVIRDTGGATVTATTTANVADAALSATATPIAATEGQPITLAVASFTDANPATVAGNYTATIDWGDGSSLTTGSVTASAGGGFTVTGTHTYGEEASNLTATVVIRDKGGAIVTAITTANVADAALSATATPIAATEGQAVTLTLASFTDANPAAVAGDYTATIDWGDGSSLTTGSVTASAGGAFAVTGTHTYGEEASNLPVTVVIRDNGGAIVTAVTTANVADAALSATAAPIAATEGQAVTLTVASFTDANPATVVGDYTATIDWGDGNSLATGSVTANAGGGFAITGTHIYGEEASNLPVTVVIRDTGGATVTATTTANVADAALTASPVTASFAAGVATSELLATFTDANPLSTVSDFSATIDWGDGSSTSQGSIASSGGTFEITSSHAYAAAGTFTVEVTVHDVGTSSATATSRADVEAAVAQSGTQVYVEAAYNDLLGRAADPSGLAYWVGKIEGGASRGSFAEALIHSDEYYAAQVKAAYQQVLQRAADATGLSYWVGQLRAGLTDAALQARLAGSQEAFDAAGDDNTAWLGAAYQELLGRAIDPAGQAHWLGQLAAGTSRSGVAAALLGGVEGQTAKLADDYFHFLGRTPDEPGQTYWLKQLTNGIDANNIAASMVASAEYFRRVTAS